VASISFSIFNEELREVKMARPKGTDKEYQLARDTVATRKNVERWAADLLTEGGLQYLADIAKDPNAPAQVRKGIIDSAIKINAEAYAVRKGRAEYTVVEADAAENREEADSNGGKPALSLAYGG